MLFLLGPENLEGLKFQLEESDFVEVALRDLFDFNSGIIEETFNYTKIEKQFGNRLVHFLSIKGVRFFVDGSLKEELFKEYLKVEELKYKVKKGTIKDAEINKNKHKELKSELDEDKIIKNGDYLLLTRGDPKGYSFLELSEEINQRYAFVPNNQFIVVRPRPIHGVLESIPSNEYLHKCVLQPLLEFHLSKYVSEKEKDENNMDGFFSIKQKQQKELQEKAQSDNLEEINYEVLNKKYSSKNRVSISTLKKMKVRLPKSARGQMELLEKLKKFEEEYAAAEFKLLNIKESLGASLKQI